MLLIGGLESVCLPQFKFMASVYYFPTHRPGAAKTTAKWIKSKSRFKCELIKRFTLLTVIYLFQEIPIESSRHFISIEPLKIFTKFSQHFFPLPLISYYKCILRTRPHCVLVCISIFLPLCIGAFNTFYLYFILVCVVAKNVYF